MAKEIERESDYCKNCKQRATIGEGRKKEKIDLNVPGFCGLGYTQNPKTETTTFNIAKNQGIYSVCSFNPWRSKALARLGHIDPVNPFERNE